MKTINELNPLETRFRSWKPRRPSARLEDALFPRATEPRPEASPDIRDWVRWFAPATACVLLATLAMNPRVHSSNDGGAMMAMIFSNQSFAAYLPGSFTREQNRWDTFEWTNHGHSGSSVAPFSPVRALE